MTSRDGWAQPVDVAPMPPAVDEHELPLDERLMISIETQIAAEADSLDAYRELVASTPDSMVAFVIAQILEDEQQHHDLQRRMLASLRRGLYRVPQPDTIPGRSAPVGADLEALIATTKQRIKEEQHHTRELRRLAREDNRTYGGLFAMLLETMAKDSEKHELMLRFLQKRLESDARL